MATSIGNYGLVYADGVVVAQMRGWSVDQQGTVIDATVMGMANKAFHVVQNAWTATLTVFWDPDDDGQAALPVGTQVAIAGFPIGDDEVGAPVLMGYARVTGLDIAGTHNGMVEATLELLGTDILPEAILMGGFGALHDLIANDLWTHA